ncbi:multidrug efflux SMR transporter [Sodalis sp. dw_96]|uniref:DMT family transporter n=1 Tax=Sodalis sp. dw_96 TaxID=2719794 RepID=UPI001BD541FA|nr:multidrug efflux SMR transporter [Sodalis sp. dw_96]
MAWFYLLAAGLFEVIWASAMKASEGFTRLTPSVITLVFMISSFALLAIAMKTLPLGTAYTVWVGIGAIGAFILGVVLFGESINLYRIIAVALIISGVTLLKVISN